MKLNLLLTLIFVTSCSLKSKTDSTISSKPSENTKDKISIINQRRHPQVVEIQFHEGSYLLSPAARQSLQEAVRRSRRLNPVHEINILSWPDSKSKNQNKISEKQKDLATKRNQMIELFLSRRVKDANIKTFNIAKKPDSLALLLEDSEEPVKNSLENIGLTSKQDASAIESKSSKSVVLIILE